MKTAPTRSASRDAYASSKDQDPARHYRANSSHCAAIRQSIDHTTASPLTVHYTIHDANSCTNPTTYDVAVVVNPDAGTNEFTYPRRHMQWRGIKLSPGKWNSRTGLHGTGNRNRQYAVGTTGAGNPNEALTNTTAAPLQSTLYLYTDTNSCTNRQV